MNPLFQALRVVNGAARDADTFVAVMMLDALAGDPDKPHAAIYLITGRQARRLARYAYNITSSAFLPDGTVAALGEWGPVHFLTVSDDRSEELAADRGPLRCIRWIGGSLYVVGCDAQTLRRELDGRWTDFSPSPDQRKAHPFNDMEMVDGFSSSELYAAGCEGVVWWFNGRSWTAVECATNMTLHAVHCAPDGTVWVVGQMGIVLRGRFDRFEIVEQPEPLTDLWSVAVYQGTTRAAGFVALLKLVDGLLAPDSDAMALAESFYDLQVVDGVLWSFGMKDVLKFDGKNWTRIDELDVS